MNGSIGIHGGTQTPRVDNIGPFLESDNAKIQSSVINFETQTSNCIPSQDTHIVSVTHIK